MISLNRNIVDQGVIDAAQLLIDTTCGCASNPCLNGASCIEQSASPGYFCACGSGTVGEFCTADPCNKLKTQTGVNLCTLGTDCDGSGQIPVCAPCNRDAQGYFCQNQS